MKSIFEQMGGTYSQVGDYLLPNITIPEESSEPIGVWGQRHARYLKEHRKVLYMNLLTSGKFNTHLAEIDKQAEDMFYRLVKEMAEKQGVTQAASHICFSKPLLAVVFVAISIAPFVFSQTPTNFAPMAPMNMGLRKRYMWDN